MAELLERTGQQNSFYLTVCFQYEAEINRYLIKLPLLAELRSMLKSTQSSSFE